MSRILVVIGIVLLVPTLIWADAKIPTADLAGAKDHPSVGRFKGSWIIAYEAQDFGELTFPLSPLQPVKGKKDAHNNTVFEPQEKKTLEGNVIRLVYVTPAGASPLEVIRNYQEEIAGKGGKTLFECQEAACGGDATRSSAGGGGKMSLSMYLYPSERIKEPPFSNGACAQTKEISGQRYLVGEIPEKNVFLSVLTYTVHAERNCKALNDYTIAIVNLVEVKGREQKMVTLNAAEMSQEISAKGSVALYGIYFDTDKAEVKPESEPTLAQIAELLSDTPALKVLVVGHTDNVGKFAYNQELSQRRAEAVVKALVSQYKVDKGRLTPVGVSFACPVAPNTTEDGRAKNRRVELVAE